MPYLGRIVRTLGARGLGRDLPTAARDLLLHRRRVDRLLIVRRTEFVLVEEACFDSHVG